MSKWFEIWFDSHYYHTLYNNRDEGEAQKLITSLVDHLALNKNDRVLDLACGKGRHSAQLKRLGLRVTGVDLSPESIVHARKQYPDIDFLVGDMRHYRKENTFDAVFNLFTSFGYFDDQNDNQLMLQSIHNSLKKGGYFILDFMNAEKVKNGLVLEEEKQVGEVLFKIKRSCDGRHFIKEIEVIDPQKDGLSFFQEKVQYLPESVLLNLVGQNGFKVKDVFGDFELTSFQEDISDRCIIIAKKGH